jgi:hypothetical protein
LRPQGVRLASSVVKRSDYSKLEERGPRVQSQPGKHMENWGIAVAMRHSLG